MIGRVLLPAEFVRRRAPLGLDPGDERLFAHELEKTIPETRLSELCAVTVLPNGFLVRGPAAWPLPESFVGRAAGPARAARRLAKRILSAPTQLAPLRVPRGLVVTDEFSNGYFHWLADCLPRLAVLDEQGLLQGRTLIVPDHAGRFAYARPSLEAFDLPGLVFPGPRRAVRCGELVVLSPVAPTGNYRPAVMDGLRERCRRRFGGSGGGDRPGRRLYVSRARAPWRRVANEDELVGLLARHGVERVFLEELSFADEVRLLCGTSLLVGGHGAGLANMLFMPRGGRVIELRLAGDAANNCYFSLASDLGHEYRQLQCEPLRAGRDAHTADVRVDCGGLERLLEEIPSDLPPFRTA